MLEVRRLVVRIATENPHRGYTRIQGALLDRSGFAKLRGLLRTAGRRTMEGLWHTVGGCVWPHLCHRMPHLFSTGRIPGHYTIMTTAPRG